MERNKLVSVLKKAVLSAALFTALGASLTACGSDDRDSPKSDAAPTAEASWVEDQIAAAEEREASTFVVGLTDVAKWEDGVAAKLSEFTRRRTSEDDSSMFLDANEPYLSFKITVTNGTKEPLALRGFNMVCPADSTEVRTDDIVGIPDNHLLVNDSVTWTAACTFQPTQTKLQVELTPPVDESTMEMPPTAIFNGTIATK